MLNPSQLRELIVEVLDGMGLSQPAAVNLLLGTAAQESSFGTYIKQLGAGPALGVFQMEPATERDIWENFLKYKPDLVARLTAATGESGPGPHLKYNLAYQIAMARIHYCRQKSPLPAADDVAGLAAYWKEHYNTPLGRGTEKEFIQNYARYVEG